jgi:hypothetical protein
MAARPGYDWKRILTRPKCAPLYIEDRKRGFYNRDTKIIEINSDFP